MPGVPDKLSQPGGILSASRASNPLFADWNHVYLWYCTSDSHLGAHLAAVAGPGRARKEVLGKSWDLSPSPLSFPALGHVLLAVEPHTFDNGEEGSHECGVIS